MVNAPSPLYVIVLIMVQMKNKRLQNPKPILLSIVAMLFMLYVIRAFAETQYLSTDQFLQAYLTAEVPKPAKLWLGKAQAQRAEKILGHRPYQRVQKYWQHGNKTAWILEEIGKVEFITAGFVVEDGKIADVRVLTYRESRGGEVRYKSFLKQYKGAFLKEDSFLDRKVDGISGATLSVWSMNRMARLALYYDQLSREK